MLSYLQGDSAQWQKTGAWPGGTVSALAISPHVASDGLVLAATLAGIYRSVDRGQRWQPSLSGLSDLTTHSVLLASGPGDTLTAFAATQQGRLYRSLDAGDSWEEVLSWAGLGMITTLAVSPAYGEDGTLFVATVEGVFRSFDRGERWQSASFGLLDPEVLCLACAPDFARSETLWVGTAAGGFYRSRNAGRAWRESGFGLPDSAIQCLALAPDFAQSQVIFAGTENAGVFYSTDAGANWRPAGSISEQEPINCLAISPDYAQDQEILAGTSSGIFRSTDGGMQWQPVQGGYASPLALAYLEKAYILAGNYGTGIALSEDGGRHLQPPLAGMAAHIPPLAVDGPQGQLVAAAVDGGLATSLDGGATWQVDPAGLASPEVRLLVSGGQIIFAATPDHLYRAHNPAQGWHSLAVPLAGEAQLTLLAAPAHCPYVLVGTGTGQLYLSADSGDQWQPLPFPSPGEAALSATFGPETPPQIYLITAAELGPGSYRVQLWQRPVQPEGEWQGLLSIDPVKIPIAALAAPETANAPLFLAVQNQVIRLTRPPGDQLLTTQAILGEDLNITTILARTTSETDYSLFVATNRGVFYALDEGLTWRSLGHGLEERAVVALLNRDKQLGAVTLGGEVWWLEL